MSVPQDLTVPLNARTPSSIRAGGDEEFCRHRWRHLSSSALWPFGLVLSDLLQLRETLLKLAAAHLVDVHDHVDSFADEILRSRHRPSDDRAGAFWLKGKFHVVGCCKWPREIQLQPDAFSRTAF